jgi:hypothetical protein
MARFGPRKIGKAAFELQEKKHKVLKSKFGPRKYGKKKAAKMAAELEELERAVVGESSGIPEATPPEAPPAPVEPARVVGEELTAASIKQIDEAMKENPALYEELYALELERPDGGRKGAFRIFLAAEMSLEGGPRDERMAELEELLAAQ